jgi:hypothetical protein
VPAKRKAKAQAEDSVKKEVDLELQGGHRGGSLPTKAKGKVRATGRLRREPRHLNQETTKAKKAATAEVRNGFF